MYEYVRGKLIEKSPHFVTLDVQGVGYKVHVPINILYKLPHSGAEVLLYTTFVVRENAQTLFGFLTKGERSFFEQLNTISGIGPKTALSLVGHLDTIDLSSSTSLCRVPGIGKKTAERILLEIKDKLPMRAPSKIKDAMGALLNLGYSQTIVERALKDADENKELSEIITEALQCL